MKKLNLSVEFLFIKKTIGAVPVAHIDQLTPEKLGTADKIDEVSLSDDSKIMKVYGSRPNSKTITVFVRGSNSLVSILLNRLLMKLKDRFTTHYVLSDV